MEKRGNIVLMTEEETTKGLTKEEERELRELQIKHGLDLSNSADEEKWGDWQIHEETKSHINTLLAKREREVFECGLSPGEHTKECTGDCDNNLDLLEEAWGIIANAGGGNWDKETSEWQEASKRFREKYFKVL